MLTALGLDNFAVAAGWVGMDFACVGEWFLGSILFLYALFPLLQRAMRKHLVLTWAVTLTVCIPVHLMGWDARLVAVHIPEFLFGMTFLTLGIWVMTLSRQEVPIAPQPMIPIFRTLSMLITFLYLIIYNGRIFNFEGADDPGPRWDQYLRASFTCSR